MKRGRRAVSMAVVCIGAMAAGSGVAAAGPENNDAALVFTATCGGEDVDFVVIGGGWSPALAVDSNQVFIPQSFNLTSTFTVQGGEPEVQLDDRSKPHVAEGAVTCTIDDESFVFPARGGFPGGTLVLDGTVTGVFRGRPA